jgi:hypothetical protein
MRMRPTIHPAHLPHRHRHLPVDTCSPFPYTRDMRYYFTYLLPLFGLLIGAFLLAAVMLDSAGYRFCDTYADPNCPTITNTPGEVRP